MNSLRRDLFERRLWPVVVGLLVAIIAVVVVLRGHTDASPAVAVPPVPAAAPALTDAGDDAGVAAAVPVSERLLRSEAMRDPFAAGVSHLTSRAPSQLTTGTTSSSGTGATPVTTTTAATLSSQSSVVSSTSGASTTASATGDSSPVTVTVTTPRTTTVTRTITTTTAVAAATTPSSWTIYGVDVSLDASGQTTHRSKLLRLTPLPTPAAPKAMFDGVTAGGHDAVFALADGVRAQGPGLCRPDPTDCVGVVLPIGGVETLSFSGVTGEPETLALSVTHISARKTHSQSEALAAARRQSTAGACEVDLADPIAWDSSTLSATAHIPGVCVMDKALVPFPGIGGA